MKRGTPTGKRPLGRPRRRWEEKIRKDLKEIGDSIENWGLFEGAHMIPVLSSRVP